MPFRNLLLLLALIAFVSNTARAQTGYPMVMSLKPVALQVGQSAEVEFQSRYSMFGAYQVLVSGSGVTGEVLHPEKKPGEKPELLKMKVKLTVETVATPGVRACLSEPRGAA